MGWSSRKPLTQAAVPAVQSEPRSNDRPFPSLRAGLLERLRVRPHQADRVLGFDDADRAEVRAALGEAPQFFLSRIGSAALQKESATDRAILP